MYLLYYLTGFNNYYNRQIKLPEATNVNEYADYFIKSSGALTPFTEEVATFNPNDGVMTSIVINYPDGVDDGIDIDYILVATSTGDILSKWFVLDRRRLREGQWEGTLRRDIVSDNYDDVVNAPCFIEKATLSADSPLLWNKENITFNQIKKDEILLKDGSGCPWIVGYYAKNTPDANLKGTIDANDLEKAYDFSIDTPISAWEFNATSTPYYGIISSIDYRVYFKDYVGGIQSQPAYLGFDRYGNFKELIYVADSDTSLDTANAYNTAQPKGDIQVGFQANYQKMYNELGNYITINSDDNVRKFLSYNGQTVKDSEGRYFGITIYADGEEKLNTFIQAGNLYNTMNNIVKNASNISGQANGSTYEVVSVRPKYNMTLVELSNLETTWDMTGDKLITDDAPYNIFAIPCGETTLKYWANDVSYSNETIGLATANSIIKTMGDYLYDIQLLPYCPIAQQVAEQGVIYVHNSDAYSVVKTPATGEITADDRPSYILNVPKAKFTKNLNYSISLPDTAVEKKVMNECEMYRLCSPNYNGAFEFSPTKNNGVAYFNVDCEYKPFQPYIHVNPNFGGMYGSDFDDARGLICNGDFSLTQIKDAWQEYQIQNKNYQEIFARQIENMEDTRDVKRTQEKWSAALGAFSAGISGAGSGMLLGGPKMALGMGIAGAATSAIGGAIDYSMSEKLHSLSLDYTRDMFGYNLANIQALPYTLTKISAYNNNNKLFPFVERYSATDEEIKAFKEKLKYNGMSVGVIGKIADYKQEEPSYIKGSIIRIENSTTLDFHSLSELSNEIYKGVFI